MNEILHPGTAFRTADNCFDYFHVGNSVLDWRRCAGVVQYCKRELVALERILVADVKQDFLYLISILIPDFTRLVRRCIERNLDLNAASSTEDVYSLIRY